jgi:ABC-2 type transport system permease protein
MTTSGEKSGEGLRIVWTIATKDILDALRNRTILFNMGMVFVIMVAYQYLSPVIYAGDGDIAIYDPAGSRLLAALENSPQFVPHRVGSIRELKEEMAKKPRGALGLAIPADLDQRLASAASGAAAAPELGGYLIWSSRSRATQLKADFERQLTALIGQPVRIEIEDTVGPQPDSIGPIRMVAVTLVITIILMGVLTVPHLMFEEKQAKTIDALLVSPASIGQVVIGKALAGSFYCLTTIGVAFAFSWAFVTHWGLAIAAALSGALLAVGLGLLLGTFFDDRQQMTIWTLIPGQFLLGPVFLTVFDVILPETLRTVMYWIPTVALAKVFRYAFSDGATLAEVLFHLGIVVISTGLILAAIVWKVRRSDR